MQKKIINPIQYNETDKTLDQWLAIIKKERLPLYHQLISFISPKTTVLEIGAGSAWLSSMLSQHQNIRNIIATDYDFRRLKLAKNYFAHKLNANPSKITFHKADFHSLDFLSNHSIDIIFVDAALHHTNTLSTLLQELYRILKPGGKIIAIREPVLPSLPILKQYRKKTFGKKQIKDGEIENIYTKFQWSSFFEKSNFNANFFPLYDGSTKDKILKRYPLKYFNGILFNRYCIIATKYYSSIEK